MAGEGGVVANKRVAGKETVGAKPVVRGPWANLAEEMMLRPDTIRTSIPGRSGNGDGYVVARVPVSERNALSMEDGVVATAKNTDGDTVQLWVIMGQTGQFERVNVDPKFGDKYSIEYGAPLPKTDVLV